MSEPHAMADSAVVALVGADRGLSEMDIAARLVALDPNDRREHAFLLMWTVRP
jgi:hypothetical protein